MTRATFGILATLSLAATSLTAQSRPLIKANVPFNFVAGARTLPAGEYRVMATTRDVMAIQNADCKTTVILASHSTQNTKRGWRGRADVQPLRGSLLLVPDLVRQRPGTRISEVAG